MNARITSINDHIESESLAPVTTISWSPTEGAQAATISFSCSRFYRYKVDGTYFGAPDHDGGISIAAAQLLGRKIPIMLPGGQVIGEQPAELLDGLLRGLFDMLYNEMRGAPKSEPQPEDAP